MEMKVITMTFEEVGSTSYFGTGSQAKIALRPWSPRSPSCRGASGSTD
jgi:hypothetical protein